MQDTERLAELTARLTGTKAPVYETPLLNERQKTHGDFNSNARATQRFRDFMRAEPGWDKLSDRQKQSLDEIVLKIARILAGNPDAREHWDDISGYANLNVESGNGSAS